MLPAIKTGYYLIFLFTKVPLCKTTKLILHRIYKAKLIQNWGRTLLSRLIAGYGTKTISVILKFCIVYGCNKWFQLLFSESFYLKKVTTKINNILKVPCELVLFKELNNDFIMTFGSWVLLIFICNSQLLIFSRIFYMQTVNMFLLY